jgi:thyroid receptor-interacting protein 11
LEANESYFNSNNNNLVELDLETSKQQIEALQKKLVTLESTEREVQIHKANCDELKQKIDSLENTEIPQYKADIETMHKKLNILQTKEKELEIFQRHCDELNRKVQMLEEALILSTNSRETDSEDLKHRNNKELERLREHLVEMSDSYTKEAIESEEREKNLRLRVNELENILQQQGTSMQASSVEIERKTEQLTQMNIKLKTERDTLQESLLQVQKSLEHQTKLTKNVEQVLERVQKDRSNSDSIEIQKYKQEIKEHVKKNKKLNDEQLKLKSEIDTLNDALADIATFRIKIKKCEEFIHQLESQLATKNDKIEFMQKSLNEVKQLNDSYVEK